MSDDKVENPDPGATDPTATQDVKPDVQPDIKPDAKAENDPKSILDKKDDPPPKNPTDWPENWRELYAGDDEKLLKQLGRFASPKAALDSYFQLQKRVSQGDVGAKKPTDKSTPEEIAAYRQSVGAPESAEDYFKELPNGLTIGEEDKGLFDSFGKFLLDNHAPKELGQKAADWYYTEVVEKNEQARYEKNREAEQAAEDTLRQEYGNEYRSHLNGLNNFLSTLPGKAGEFLAGAEFDGVSLFNHPDVFRAFVNIVNEVNPAASVIPNGGSVTSIDARLAELAKMRDSGDKKYWSNEVQAEELRLIEAKEKLKARA